MSNSLPPPPRHGFGPRVSTVLARFSGGVPGFRTRKTCFVLAFLFCAGPTGLFMALLTPAGQAPDEAAHMARAAGLLHGAVVAARRPATQADGLPFTDTGVTVRWPLFEAGFGLTTAIGSRAHVETEADQDALRAIGWGGGTMFAQIPNTATYFPVFYLPAAAGLAAGILSHQSPYGAMLTARVFMLGGFVILGSAALGLAAYGEALLLAVLLLPMTLFLAGSMNPDALLIGAACLAVAALTHAAATLPRRPVALWLAAVMLVLIVLAKLPYLPLLGFLLLPFGDLRKRAGVIALTLPPVLLWVLVLALFTIAPFGKVPYHPGPLWQGDHGVLFDRTSPAANLHILLARPSRFLSLPWHYIVTDGVQKLRETVGVLGPLVLQFSDWFYALWLAALALAAAGSALGRPAAAPAAGRQFVVGAAAIVLLGLTFWAIAISTYLNWTAIGAAAIDGLQGRYYIPLLPFLALAAPAWRRFGQLAWLPALPVLAWVPALPALALGLFDLGYLPRQMVLYFYLH